MATTDFTGLSAGTTLAAADVMAWVDVSDTSQSVNGSTLKITITNFFATVPAPVNVTSASATALAVGRLGATTPAFTVDASTASQVAGLKVTGAATGGTVALVVTDSGSNANLTLNAKGSGTIGIGSVSTGAVTITPALTCGATITATGRIWATPGSGSEAFRMESGALFYLDGGGDTYLRESAANVISVVVGGGTAMTVAATGIVDIAGTLGVTGAITTTASQGLLMTPTTATDAAYATFTNTGGAYNIGADNSVGGLSGTAYALTLYAPASRSVVLLSGGAVALTINASQGATFAGAVTVVGNLNTSSATDATSIATGSLQASGGAGITKALWVGGLANIAGAVTLQSTLAVTGDFAVATSKFTVEAVSGNTAVAGTLTVTGGITGTLTTTGAITGAAINVAGTITAQTAKAVGVRVDAALTAAANSDVLFGARVVPTYSANSKTGLTAYGVFIGSFSAGTGFLQAEGVVSDSITTTAVGSTVYGVSSVNHSSSSNAYGVFSANHNSTLGASFNYYSGALGSAAAGAWSFYATDGAVTFRTSAQATNATTGFVFMPTCAGTPTGTPSPIPTGQVPWIYDSTNNKIYVYNGGWKATAALT